MKRPKRSKKKKKQLQKKRSTTPKIDNSFPDKYFEQCLEVVPSPMSPNQRMKNDLFWLNMRTLNDYYDSIGGLMGEESIDNISMNMLPLLQTDPTQVGIPLRYALYKYQHNRVLSIIPIELRIYIYEQQLRKYPLKHRLAERLAQSYEKLRSPGWHEKKKHYLNYAYSLMLRKYREIESSQYDFGNDRLNSLIHSKKLLTRSLQRLYRDELIDHNIGLDYLIYNNPTRSIENDYYIFRQRLSSYTSDVERMKHESNDYFVNDTYHATIIEVVTNSYFGDIPYDLNRAIYYRGLDYIHIQKDKHSFTRELSILELITRINEKCIVAFLTESVPTALQWQNLSVTKRSLEIIAGFKIEETYPVKIAKGILAIIESNYSVALKLLYSARNVSSMFLNPLVNFYIAYLLKLHEDGEYLLEYMPGELDGSYSSQLAAAFIGFSKHQVFDHLILYHNLAQEVGMNTEEVKLKIKENAGKYYKKYNDIISLTQIHDVEAKALKEESIQRRYTRFNLVYSQDELIIDDISVVLGYMIYDFLDDITSKKKLEFGNSPYSDLYKFMKDRLKRNKTRLSTMLLRLEPESSIYKIAFKQFLQTLSSKSFSFLDR